MTTVLLVFFGEMEGVGQQDNARSPQEILEELEDAIEAGDIDRIDALRTIINGGN